jgi:hypothetical protein
VLWSEIALPANAEGLALLLYPLYLTLSPLVFVYGRFHSSRAVLSEVANAYQREQLGTATVAATTTKDQTEK